MSEKVQMHFRISFDWRVTLLALMLLPLLLSLGYWQLDRAEEKRQLQKLFQQRQANGPLALENLVVSEQLKYQPVTLRGEFDNDKPLLLDNRINQGRFGYEIVMPFKLINQDQWVMVNRGWVQGDSSRRSLPVIEPISRVVNLEGEIFVPHGEVLTLAHDNAEGWPRVIQNLNIKELAKEFESPIFPYSVRLKASSEGSLKPNWVVVNLQPHKHVGYAVQWFAMSFTLVLITILANTNCWEVLKQRRD